MKVQRPVSRMTSGIPGFRTRIRHERFGMQFAAVAKGPWLGMSRLEAPPQREMQVHALDALLRLDADES
jgi:hypothetical protein